MKAFSDIEQSERLAKILPPESADMYWKNGVSDKYIQCFTPFVINEYGTDVNLDYDVPCWSLAALLEIIRKPTALNLLINGRGYRCHCTDKSEGKFHGTDDYCDNAIDACIEVIIKLHEQKLI